MDLCYGEPSAPYFFHGVGWGNTHTKNLDFERGKKYLPPRQRKKGLQDRAYRGPLMTH